jgi:hypothetical protein
MVGPTRVITLAGRFSMRPIARAIGLLVFVALVAGCGRFAGAADDLARIRPPHLPGDKGAFEGVLDDAFRGFSGAEDDAQRLARSAGTDAVAAVGAADRIAQRFPGAEAKVASAIRGSLCDLGRHYLTSDEDPDIVEMLRNNGIAEVIPALQLVLVVQEVRTLSEAYKKGVSTDRIYWSARIGLQCILAGKSR